MSQSAATGRALDPTSTPAPGQNTTIVNNSVSVWKIALGVILGFVGIVGLIVGVAVYQIFSDSVKEVRSAGADGTKTVQADTLCAASIDELISRSGDVVHLYAGDTVKPKMATGSFANVVPATGVASGQMTRGCWMMREALK
jgi:CheY-specific phosphatase CheX